MLRALSTRRNRRGYDQLGKEQPSTLLHEAQLKRVSSLPARLGDQKLAPAAAAAAAAIDTTPKANKQAKKAAKTHPLFSLLYGGRKKAKTTAKPEFSRYMEYMKEGGVWDKNSNTPVIYFN